MADAFQSGRDSILEGFRFGLSLNSLYNSNIALNQNGGDDALIVSTGASFSYATLAGPDAPFSASFSYAPTYQQFYSDRDLPGAFAQNASASLNYAGPVFSVSLQGGLTSGGRQNQLAGDFVDSTAINFGGAINWNYSPKTSVGLTAGYSFNEFDGVGLGGNENRSLGVTASWQATPLFRVGPYLNFTSTTTDNAGNLDAIGVGLNFTYELTGKTSLSGAVGIQDQSFDNGGGANTFVGSLNANWTPTDLYTVTAGLTTSTLANPGVLNQITNNYSLNLGISRGLGVGSLSFGTSVIFSQNEATDLADAIQNDRQFVNFRLSYGRPIFADRVNLSSSIGYQKGFG
ncbi:MAG: hypothetical protein P1U90_22405, partial [Akkermansiaceae bacterium]|nr:hypothetical protein [Akkermansiaceae bacterium]